MRILYKVLNRFIIPNLISIKKKVVVLLFLLVSQTIAIGQIRQLHEELLGVKASNDSLNKLNPREKIYLQFDKPYYGLGDTIWFKAYLLNSFLTASEKSGIINIDIANQENKVLKRYKIAAQNGLGWGNLKLDENKGFTSGTYTITAYTNWMRNFGQNYFFSKSFYITGSDENGWLIEKRVEGPTKIDDSVKVKLLLHDINKKPVANKILKLQVLAGDNNLYKQAIQTNDLGLLNLKFKLPGKAANLSIMAESFPTGKKAVIPLELNLSQNIDLQFMPEGGYLVGGLPAHVGFKAIGEDGKGVDISGIITNHEGKKVAVFNALRYGIGSFDLAVQKGEIYTAKATLPGNIIKEYPLPLIKGTGTIVTVKNELLSDSLEVSIFATSDFANLGNDYFLIGKARGVICYAATFNFIRGNVIKKKIAKSLFPDGITKLVMLTTNQRPLNERMTYIGNHDNLHIRLKTNLTNYAPHDSVALNIKVTDDVGNPIAGNFSMAVTDDAEVKTDTMKDGNMLTQMLLTADLQGRIEQPNYYLSSKTAESWQALDNLLITQGWIGYNWEQYFNSKTIIFKPVNGFGVKGRVLNGFNKPVRQTNVLLFSKSPTILMSTTTNNNGEFYFDNFPRIDTPIFVLKAVNKSGKSFNVDIVIDNEGSPEIIKLKRPLVAPWYLNTDTTLISYAKVSNMVTQHDYMKPGTRALSEVKILGMKIIKGSQNLNGSGNADFALNERDLEKALKKSWLQLFEEKIKGFQEMNLPPHYPLSYYMNFKEVIFLVDGVVLTSVYQSMDFPALKNYLQSHTAEDIKGIEVMSSSKFVGKYSSRFYPYASPDNLAFVEITTRSGHGPIIDNTPGMYLYKPLPLSWPAQFYKPKFKVNDVIKDTPDFRPTINWEPNIFTDINGEAKVWFYAGDKPTTYTVIIEGTNMNGGIGYERGKICIETKNK
ncbi:hypothetical protein [Mucilaginibacter gilvus]|uniref:Carboxypeptidase regulatory-like domain-containing protein n=1 Tax=Mucilaginibacter gilvus TaxID=2305909 RepID=A0A444MJG9_9SPHI|nr:hypothetical protein [Mucilaginibacter gilvus]RWY48326.1 hypothetical protein EPL05_19480 [Mucilaginibacter gilvus]